MANNFAIAIPPTSVGNHIPNTLMLSNVWSYLPTSRHHAWVCSAGSKGYCALKEMLQNGTPGNTLLLESGDLRDVGCDVSSSADTHLHSREGLSSSVLGDDLRHVDRATPTKNDNSTNVRCRCLLVYTNVRYDEISYTATFRKRIPITVSHISVYSNLEVTPHHMLMECHTLTSIDLSPPTSSLSSNSHPHGVDNFFLRGCSSLEALDLSPLSHVTRLGGCFALGCASLSTLDLGSLSNITMIPYSFLEGCTSLTSLDLSPLSNVITIHSSFLEGCTGLKSLHFGAMSNVTEIHQSFLEGCTSLASLDLTRLSKLSVVQRFFLKGCTGLTELNLNSLSHLVTIHNSFLEGCTGITSLDLSPLSNVTEIHERFLEGCIGLTSLDLGPLVVVRKIHHSFLHGCTGLVEMVLCGDVTLCSCVCLWVAVGDELLI